MINRTTDPDTLQRLTHREAKTEIQLQPDVARLRRILNDRGFDANQHDIYRAYREWSKEHFGMTWYRVEGSDHEQLFAGLRERLRPAPEPRPLVQDPNPLGPSPRTWRSLLVTVRLGEVARAEGYRASLETLIADVVAAFRLGLDRDCRDGFVTPAQFSGQYGDTVIWDQYRVAALVRPRSDGAVDVTRF